MSNQPPPSPPIVGTLTITQGFYQIHLSAHGSTLPPGQYDLTTMPATITQPSVPAQWREAMKVAREALKACEVRSVSEWEVVDMTPKIVRAALAQLDALGGVE